MFDAGAGKVGDYDTCALRILSQGQYKPGKASNLFKGEQSSLKTLSEYKVEMVCASNYIAEVVKAMKGTHPYEEVAYAVIRTEVFEL
jgi:structural hemagglutinin/hemolysin toxin protein RtxA